ncbi:MAG: twin-arginine translocase subunit TatC [Chloroflexi bacterium]|nr:MAG: twin-arginine translocase subunit TatC [Chloroflexota bacterium]
MTDDQATMSLFEHLTELRRRLIIVIVAVVVAAIAGFVLSDLALRILVAPLPPKYEKLFFTGVLDPFAVKLKVAVFLGVALAMPVILHQVYRFVTPGLTRRERRLVWPVLIATIALFVLGMAVGYVIIPFALAFLLSFATDQIVPLLTLPEYVGFVTTMLLAFGLVLEFPVVLIILARAGIVSHRSLASRRRQIIVGITIFAVIVTPGGDPFSPAILGSVMYVLFELSLLVVRMVRR